MAAELDLTVVVPALQAAFGERYGGYWLELQRRNDVMHVGVVEATDADGATVASVTGGHPRVVTDAVAQGYDALTAVKDEIAASLDPAAGDFSVEVDVAANAVVVHTEGDGAAAAATAPDAARRGAARAAERRGGQGGAVPPVDPASAVRIEPQSDIAVQPLGVGTREAFPPHEAGLGITVAVGPYRIRCTTGWMFWNQWYGYFGSTAGHCSRAGDGVVIGGRIVDAVRANSYQGQSTVWGRRQPVLADRRRVAGWAVVHNDLTHYAVNQKGDLTAAVAGMLSSAVTINGVTSMCFSTINNIEAVMNSQLVMG